MPNPYTRNSFSRCGPGLSDLDIQKAEEALGLQIPPPLRSHYGYCNGGQPANRKWVASDEPEQGEDELYYIVATFFPLQDEEDLDVLETYTDGVEEGYLPVDFLPFARDQGGNFFCVDLKSGRVVWYVLDTWDEERTADENAVAATTPIADDFETFVEGLVEEDWDDE